MLYYGKHTVLRLHACVCIGLFQRIVWNIRAVLMHVFVCKCECICAYGAGCIHGGMCQHQIDK